MSATVTITVDPELEAIFTVLIPVPQSGLPQDSVALAFQIRPLDKSRLIRKAGHLNVDQMAAIDRAPTIHLNLQ